MVACLLCSPQEAGDFSNKGLLFLLWCCCLNHILVSCSLLQGYCMLHHPLQQPHITLSLPARGCTPLRLHQSCVNSSMIAARRQDCWMCKPLRLQLLLCGSHILQLASPHTPATLTRCSKYNAQDEADKSPFHDTPILILTADNPHGYDGPQFKNVQIRCVSINTTECGVHVPWSHHP